MNSGPQAPRRRVGAKRSCSSRPKTRRSSTRAAGTAGGRGAACPSRCPAAPAAMRVQRLALSQLALELLDQHDRPRDPRRARPRGRPTPDRRAARARRRARPTWSRASAPGTLCPRVADQSFGQLDAIGDPRMRCRCLPGRPPLKRASSAAPDQPTSSLWSASGSSCAERRDLGVLVELPLPAIRRSWRSSRRRRSPGRSRRSARASALASGVLGGLGPPLHDELLEVLGRDVDIGGTARPGAAAPRRPPRRRP